MKKRTKFIIVLFFAVLAAVAYSEIQTEFPELGLPIINRYIGNVEETTNGSRYKTYYDELSNVEKQAYNLILDNIYDMPEKIKVPDMTEKQLDEVFKSVLNDNPDLFFLGRKCRLNSELWNTYISFDYIMTADEYKQKKAKLELERDVLIESLSDLTDPWQTELEIHDYIIGHCVYKLEDEDYTYSSAYGCLVNGEAACEGYSKAAKYVFDKVGIESALVSGKANGNGEGDGDHMWNIVKINGDYYHLDCTWDDPVSKSAGSLKLYTYFNVTDKTIGINHSDYSYDPGCTATAENYFVKQKLIIDSYDSNSEEALRDMLLRQYNAGQRGIQINFANETSYQNAYNELIKNSRIYRVLSGVRSNTGSNLSDKLNGYYGDDNFYILTILFN